MSVAFTKEADTDNAAAVDLPDRPVSPHPNIVTEAGLAQLETALAKARLDYAASQAADGRDGDRRALARAARDMRYFAARLATAQVFTPPSASQLVRFGATVTIQREDGRRQTLRIVGEDEADPATGTISYTSPLASALTGKRVGDVSTVARREVEIVAVV